MLQVYYITKTAFLYSLGCGSPVVSSGTVVVGNDFKVEARLKYACATGYSNNGSSLITCESNGQWSSLDACSQGTDILFLLYHCLSFINNPLKFLVKNQR
jgi:hypothetical protein